MQNRVTLLSHLFLGISGMCSVQLGRTRHIRKKLHFTDECHQMMVLIRKRAHFTDTPPLSLSRHKVFSRKGCVAARGTSQFRRVCSRYRVFDRKRCVAGRESCPMSGNLFAIQGFRPKKVCHGRKSSSRCENLFAIQTLGVKRACRGRTRRVRRVRRIG